MTARTSPTCAGSTPDPEGGDIDERVGDEVLWIAGFATIAGMLLFALFAGISWAATMLGSWTGSF